MAVSDPFYVPFDLLPEAVRPSGLNVLPVRRLDLSRDAADLLADQIVAWHERRLLGKRVPFTPEEMGAVRDEGGDATVVITPEFLKSVARHEHDTSLQLGRWNRSAELSLLAWELACHVDSEGEVEYPFNARMAVANALGVVPELERLLRGFRMQPKVARGESTKALATAAGVSERAARDLREYLTRRAHADIPFDAVGRVITACEPVPQVPVSTKQKAAAREVAFHLWVKHADGAVDAMAYALGLVEHRKHGSGTFR